jgi:alpha-tubulin suppressor-like RCC1 family protein
VKGGTPYCWGSNDYGLLGQGANDTNPHPTPVAVKDITNIAMTGVEELAVGRSHACLWKTNGTVWCWGNEPSGAVGPGGAAAFLAREITF